MKCSLLSIGDRVGEGAFVLHSRFRRVVNFANGTRLISLVVPEIGAGPSNILMDGLDPAEAKTLEVTGDCVVINGIACAFTPAQVYDSSMNFCTGRRIPAGNLDNLKNLLIVKAPEKSMAFLLDFARRENFRPGFEEAVCDQLQQGVDLLFGGDIAAGVEKLHGCGFGLTPSGDDFIAGVLIGLHMADGDHSSLRDKIYRHAQGGSLLVSNFLSLAHEGRIDEMIRSLLESLLGNRQDVLANSAVKLFAAGATSGADFCSGIYKVLNGDISCLLKV